MVEINSNCPADLEDELKFDCFPQGNAAKDSCLSRGCCWTPTEKQSVPFCYYSFNYALYSFVNVSRLSEGSYDGVVSDLHFCCTQLTEVDSRIFGHQVGYLEQTGKSGYPEDIPLLKLVATFESRSRLRVKMFDAENQRYEVNVLPDTDTLTAQLPVDDTDYEFFINTDVPGFSVSRKSNQEVVVSLSYSFSLLRIKYIVLNWLGLGPVFVSRCRRLCLFQSVHPDFQFSTCKYFFFHYPFLIVLCVSKLRILFASLGMFTESVNTKTAFGTA